MNSALFPVRAAAVLPPVPEPKPKTLTAAQAALIAHLQTPEDSVKAFLLAWERANWLAMYAACQWTWKYTEPGGANYLRIAFGAKCLLRVGDATRTDAPGNPSSATVADFTVPILYRACVLPDDEPPFCRLLCLRVIREAGAYKPFAGEGSYWGVNPLSALREEPLAVADAFPDYA
jgi:hypothetical protein